MSKGSDQTLGQKIGSFFVGLLALVVFGFAGYGGYALVDTYLIPDKAAPEQTENTPDDKKTEEGESTTGTAEYVMAESAVENYVA